MYLRIRTSAMRMTARLLGVGVVLLASACGGGGGGGGGGAFLPVAGGTSTPSSPSSPTPATTPPNTSLKVSFDTAALTMNYQMGATATGEAVIHATAEGTSSDGLVVRMTTPGGQPSPHVDDAQVTITGRSARIVVKPKAGLPPGVYKGQLVLQACFDSACTANYTGSPWTVSYTLTVTMVYAALDTSGFGAPKTLVYDAVRGDIYASYPSPYGGTGLNAIARFRSSSAGWAGTTLSVPGLGDIAMATDGSVLAATDASNHVHLIDPASFSVKSSHLSPAVIATEGSFNEVGIAFTNDGKLWMSTGSLSWHDLGFFDLRTSSFGSATPRCRSCYGTQFFSVSGDGSRLMLTQSAAISPAPPMLYRDSADGTFRENPVGLTFFYYLTSLSHSGDRFLMMGHAVYDRLFGTVGRVPQPPKGVRAAQMSPDGRRAYVLTYATSPSDPSPPEIQVFDTSAPAGTQLDLPLVGSFTLPDRPGCQTNSLPTSTDCIRPRMRLTPDGNNLVILGSEKLIVTPIPQALSGS